jgi:hypothetical protein
MKKVMAMTTTQTRHTFTHWVTAPIRAFCRLNAELTGAGAAIAYSNRFPGSGLQADVAQATGSRPASSSKVLVEV